MRRTIVLAGCAGWPVAGAGQELPFVPGEQGRRNVASAQLSDHRLLGTGTGPQLRHGLQNPAR